MNYYEHHLGDWAAATGHLTWDEDMAYTRLLRAYYHAERAIPEGQQYRLAKASTPAQRKAVDAVLSEFFVLIEGHHHQKRADAEIARFQAGEPEREVKKANEDNRLKRHREERARLFKVLTDAGQHAPWNVGMTELREMVKRFSATAPATEPETALQPLPATAPATPATATQTPDTSLKEKREERAHRTVADPPPARALSSEPEPPAPSAPPDPHPPDPQGFVPTPAGMACRAMKRAKLQAVNPGDPRLIALVAQGATEAEFEGMAREAVDRGKGFAWVLAALQGRRAEAAEIDLAPKPAVDPMAWTKTRNGVIERGAALSVLEVPPQSGTPEWERYRRRVMAADEQQRTGKAA